VWFAARALDGVGRRLRIGVAAALVILAAWSCYATGALTLLQQRAYGPLVATGTRARFIDFQLSVHDSVPGGTPSGVIRGDLPLPEPAGADSLFVVGKCDGLYWSSGRFWHPVEQTPVTGKFNLRVTLDPSSEDEREPLVSATDDRGSSLLWIRRVDDEHIRFEYEWTGKDQTLIEGVTPDEAEIGQRVTDPVRVTPGDPFKLRVRVDPAGYVGVRMGGAQVMSTFAPVANARAAVGRQSVSDEGATRLRGSVDTLSTPTPICDRLTRQDD
jgi:hypothetical protein